MHIYIRNLPLCKHLLPHSFSTLSELGLWPSLGHESLQKSELNQATQDPKMEALLDNSCSSTLSGPSVHPNLFLIQEMQPFSSRETKTHHHLPPPDRPQTTSNRIKTYSWLTSRSSRSQVPDSTEVPGQGPLPRSSSSEIRAQLESLNHSALGRGRTCRRPRWHGKPH